MCHCAGLIFVYTGAGYSCRAECFYATEPEVERDKLLEEVQVVSDAVQQNIYENAHVALDRKAYQKKYDDLTARYEALKARLDELNEQISRTQSQKAGVEDFLTAFERMPEELAEFTLDAFNALTDFITVYSEKDIRVTFCNGQEIQVRPKHKATYLPLDSSGDREPLLY